MEFDRYLKMVGMSKSGFTNFAKSAENYQHKLQNPIPQNKAMRNGTIIHTATLEPARYREEYAVAPKVDKRTKAGKAKWQAFVDLNPGKEVITQEEHDLAMGISNAVNRSQKARKLLREARVEVSVFWDDPEYGFACKARPDALNEASGVIIDLKTTNDAVRFNKTILNFKYHWQAAFYLRGMNAVQPGAYTDFIIIAVETTPPYYTNILKLSQDYITIAEIEMSTLFGDYARCLENDAWPGPPDEINEIEPPEYYRRKFESDNVPF
jgi:hypothetical protein